MGLVFLACNGIVFAATDNAWYSEKQKAPTRDKPYEDETPGLSAASGTDEDEAEVLNKAEIPAS